mgnify:CR=1 FL=1
MNSNIRCIEMKKEILIKDEVNCWIVTLDVLKFKSIWYTRMCRSGWIVTLDVLKSFMIDKLDIFPLRWIVTLDVLKCTRIERSDSGLPLNSNIRCIEIHF